MTDSCPQETASSKLGIADELRPWEEVSRDGRGPFVHTFRTRRHRYVYDVNTRRILRVSDTVWSVLDDYGCLSASQIAVKHARTHGRREVDAALEQIAKARQEGLLLSVRPKTVLPAGGKRVADRLAQQREQLILNVTEDCNFRCAYCVFGGTYRHHRRHSPKAMSWVVARPAIDEFLSHSGQSESRVISFYGGEPLLNLSLIRKCLAHVRQGQPDPEVRFAVTTNGSLLRGAVAEFLADERFMIVVSLDGPKEIHDRHRRARGGAATWDQVVSNVRDLLTAYPEYRTNGRIRFNAVATPTTNLQEVQAFFSSFDLFTDAMGLELAGQKGTSESVRPDEPLAVSGGRLYEDFIRALRDGTMAEKHTRRAKWVQTSAFQRPFSMFHKRGYLSPHLPERMVLLNTCIPGSRRTFVNADGNYFACERVLESEAGRIGSVRTGVDAEKVVDLLDRWTRASRDQCRHCWCLPTCAVGCFASLDDDGTVTERAKRKACAGCRRQTHQLLTDYCEILEENPKAFDYMSEINFM